MSARFNHTIIAARSRHESADFYRHVLEAHDAPSWGAFTNLQLDGDVLLQFAEPPIDFPPQHYAFITSEEQFDRAMAWIRASGREHWADPQRQRPGETNTEHGGRGVYTLDPAGHYIELITRPYISSVPCSPVPWEVKDPRSPDGDPQPAHGVRQLMSSTTASCRPD